MFGNQTSLKNAEISTKIQTIGKVPKSELFQILAFNCILNQIFVIDVSSPGSSFVLLFQIGLIFLAPLSKIRLLHHNHVSCIKNILQGCPPILKLQFFRDNFRLVFFLIYTKQTGIQTADPCSPRNKVPALPFELNTENIQIVPNQFGIRTAFGLFKCCWCFLCYKPNTTEHAIDRVGFKKFRTVVCLERFLVFRHSEFGASLYFPLTI